MLVKELLRYFYKTSHEVIPFVNEDKKILGLISSNLLMKDVNDEEFLNKRISAIMPDILITSKSTDYSTKFSALSNFSTCLILDNKYQVSEISFEEFTRRYVSHTQEHAVDFSDFFLKSPLPVFIFDTSGTLELKNDSCQKLEDKLGGDIAESLIPSIIAGFDVSRHKNEIEAAIETNDGEVDINVLTVLFGSMDSQMYASVMIVQKPSDKIEPEPDEAADNIQIDEPAKNTDNSSLEKMIHDPSFSLENYMAKTEKNIISDVVKIMEGDVLLAAKILKISKSELEQKMKRFDEHA